MRLRHLAVAAVALAAPILVRAQQVDPQLFSDLRWRNIGPLRGGRTVAATGVRGQPNVFYVGVTNGGVWKSDDFGRTWDPIFDEQPTGSIGAIAVAPSDPNVVYVGTGEGLQRPDLATGDGIYRSNDAGQTWTHLGLRDGQQIAQVAVDPTNAQRLFVAVLGHPYGPNEERGVYRSTDGGASFRKVLYSDENTGAVDVLVDQHDPNTVFAVMWAARQAPWEIGSSFTLSEKNGLFKSTDGGTTWRRIGDGLPTAADGLGRIGIDLARSNSKRMYAVVGAQKHGGIYRSDDAGEHWSLINDDLRLWDRDGDFNEVKIDPKNPDRVYIANVVTWQSEDGGKTFTPWRGAPGGDDYHRLWINPDNTNIILVAVDQGAIVTVNRGETFSSWYNQPTAQMFHVNADNAFPYRLCGGQQESGSACVATRSDYGRITFRDWAPVAVEEYGYAVPDPLDADVVYGGKVTRYDRRANQVQNVAPKVFGDSTMRHVRTAPLVFSQADPHALYFGTNVLWKTVNGGRAWTQISRDLTRDSASVPAVLGAFTSLDPEQGKHRGVIYTIAPSPKLPNLVWIGTDDGLIQVTHDGGKTWKDVTPPELRAAPWSKISIMDASRFDTLEAYAAVNTFRRDELHPLIYRTRDGGETWQRIVNGIADGAITNVVRADPKKKGLLYAGTENQVWFSVDDGDNWQSLRLNMPATSIRDLIVHDDDIDIATHGRGFWVLDAATPLRQITSASAGATAILYTPATSMRWRWDRWPDTPLPPDEPGMPNPPEGAVIDYYLGTTPNGVVTLDILDVTGRVVRRYASTDTAQAPVPGRNIPDYWIRPAQVLSAEPGHHRFTWDLRWPTPAFTSFDYPISATPENTVAEPRGPWAMPGRYNVRLTVNGQSYTQPLVVRMDPRVKMTTVELMQQFALSRRIADGVRSDSAALAQVRAMRARIAAQRTGAAAQGDSLTTLDAQLEDAARTLGRLAGQLQELYGDVVDADAAPTPQVVAAVGTTERALSSALNRIKGITLP